MLRMLNYKDNHITSKNKYLKLFYIINISILSCCTVYSSGKIQTEAKKTIVKLTEAIYMTNSRRELFKTFSVLVTS